MDVPSIASGNNFGRESWTLIAFAFAVVVLRCVARIQVTGVRKLRLDDWGMKVAVVSIKDICGSETI